MPKSELPYFYKAIPKPLSEIVNDLDLFSMLKEYFMITASLLK